MPARPSRRRRTCWRGGRCSSASRLSRSSAPGKPQPPRWPRPTAGISQRRQRIPQSLMNLSLGKLRLKLLYLKLRNQKHPWPSRKSKLLGIHLLVF
ncbi:hypothetical protein E2562_000709 [Oryza meyeriana var. granulata]|uniref:Uncharacterized protein n=1 Tax=Oryza meyeriana var. granulata TaxID=110450 RepID=A0A6G1DU99_9ORYZ|nr:hypothetical protein E2562_000709 [Oryza meyeriana var. granulata]